VELGEVQVPGQAREELQTDPILQVQPIEVRVDWVAPVEQIVILELSVGPVDWVATPARVFSVLGEPQQVLLALASNDRVGARVQAD
jgi:hypothetical protein